MPIREPLPNLGIPLREGEPRIVLELQAIMDQTYLNGRYDMLEYDGPPDPPLVGADALWAEERLVAAGRRPVAG